MTRNILVAALFAVGACVAQPAMSQSNCNTYESAQQSLSERYGEYLAWEGVVRDNTVIVQLWVNPVTGTWTHLVVSPGNIACLVADGFTHTFVDPPIPGDDM